jgi:hypothetical protein
MPTSVHRSSSPSSRDSARPGDLTAVMRAMTRAGEPDSLRVAVVRRGRVVDERLLPRGAAVTVGPTENSTFLVAPEDAAGSFRMFDWSGGECVLGVPRGASARLSIQGREVELPAAGADTVKLDASARGRVLVGGTTFLFQFVAVPAAPPRPQLPLSVKQGVLGELDWKTTFIAAFSFLFHFGAIGSAYADWADPMIDDEVAVGQLVDSLTRGRLPPIPTEVPLAPPTPSGAATADPKSPPAAAHPSGNPSPHVATGGPIGQAGATLDDRRAQRLSQEMARLDLEMVGVLSAKGNATGVVLDGGNSPAGLLEQAAKSAEGAGHGSAGGLHMEGSLGQVVRPGSIGGPPIGDTTRHAPVTSGVTETVARPPGRANVEPPTVGGSVVPNAASTVARMAPGFHRCYKRGLDIDPTIRGTVRIRATIGHNGEVTSAVPSGGAGLGDVVVPCVVQRVVSTQFDPPAGGGAVVVIPVSFQPQ